jgi:NAD(P)-dependent dehydrogenase (short-subunit alcohol dehydrogenase family)
MSKETTMSRRSILTGATIAAATAAGVARVSAQGPAAGRANPNGRFAGKVVAITGATSGIGRVTAEEFAREGAKVAFCGRREPLGREVEAGIRAFGGEALFIRADVRNKAEVDAFIAETVRRFGRLDVLFANAGVGQPFVEVGAVSEANYAEMFATNVTGKYNAMVAAAPHLERARGAIINTTSIFGVKAGANAVAYSATMHAISGMTMGAALELAPKGIRVNAVAPGAITDTQFMVPIMGRTLNAEEIKTFGPFHALGRTGTSLEVAKAVMFLAHADASFVTGEVMKVDGYFLRG